MTMIQYADIPRSSHQPAKKTMYEKEVEKLIERFQEIDRIELSGLSEEEYINMIRFLKRVLHSSKCE